VGSRSKRLVFWYKAIAAVAVFTGANVLAPFAIGFKYNATLSSDAGRDPLGSAFVSHHATNLLIGLV
jgi:hypothetical protein